jgi:hypothetical protein
VNLYINKQRFSYFYISENPFMKKIPFYILIVAFMISCGSTQNPTISKNTSVQVAIDLVDVIDDKVTVRIQPGTITTDDVTFYIPETGPGTYTDSDYGK